MEALLSRGNVFSTPVSAVKPMNMQHLMSDNPFLAPATRPTGLVEVPVAVDAPVNVKLVDKKKRLTSLGKIDLLIKLLSRILNPRHLSAKQTKSVLINL